MKDPSVDFYKPFQSGEGTCYPIYPWNYYNVPTSPMFGGKRKQKKGGSCSDDTSYANGTNLHGLNAHDLNLKNNFGPFLYPPSKLPMNPQSGGKRKHKGGSNTIGPQFLTQPLVPTNPSTRQDYPYNYISAQQKEILTGSGGPQQQPLPLNEQFLSNNLGITYATQAGGKKKHKGGTVSVPEYYYNKLKGSYTPYNNPNPPAQCGGKKKHKGGDDTSDQLNQINQKQGQYGNNVTTLGQQQPQMGGEMTYRGAPGPNKPSNMSSGTNFHPEWSIGQK